MSFKKPNKIEIIKRANPKEFVELWLKFEIVFPVIFGERKNSVPRKLRAIEIGKTLLSKFLSFS